MENQRKWLGRIFVLVCALMLMFSTGVLAASPQLNKKKLTLNVGESYTFKLNNYTGKETIKWKSSNSVAASISTSGRVVARKAGKVNISASVGKKSYKCTLTIKQPVTKIKLNKSKMTIIDGEWHSLTATVTPVNANNSKVKWSSSNASVAKVTSSGRVKAVDPGTCVITATAKDGSGVKATCKVTVEPKPKKLVTKITLDKTKLNMVDGDWAQLTATVGPSTAKNKKIKWTSSDVGIAKVTSSGRVKAVEPGTAVITATAKDGSGVKASCTVTIIPKKNHRYKDGNVNISGVKKMGQSVNASKLLACLNKMSKQVEEDYKNGTPWTYGKRDNKLWEEERAELHAGGVGSVVCSQMVGFGLIEAGIFTPSMWLDANKSGKFEFGDYVKKDPNFNKKYKVLTVKKTAKQLLEEGNLLPGDICGWYLNGTQQHTNVYAGNNQWYDAGRGSHVVKKNGKHYFKTFGPSTGWGMNSKIVQIVRLK